MLMTFIYCYASTCKHVSHIHKPFNLFPTHLYNVNLMFAYINIHSHTIFKKRSVCEGRGKLTLNIQETFNTKTNTVEFSLLRFPLSAVLSNFALARIMNWN